MSGHEWDLWRASLAPEHAAVVRDEENHLLERIARGEDTPTVLAGVASFLERNIPDARAAVLLLGPDRRLRHAAAGGLPAAFVTAVDGIVVDGLVDDGADEDADEHAGAYGAALRRRRPVLVEDVSADPLWSGHREAVLRHDLRACWTLPLLSAAGAPVGALCVYHRERRLPTPQERDLVRVAMNLAEIALERDARREAGAERERHLTRMAEFRRSVMELLEESVETRDPGAFYARILERAVAVTPRAQGGAVLTRDVDGRFAYAAVRGYDLEALRRVRIPPEAVWFDPTDPQPSIARSPRIRAGLSRDEHAVLNEAGRAATIRAVLVVPVMVHGEAVAYLTLDSFDDEDAFGEDDLELARAFAGHVGTLVKRFALEADLHRMAYEDSLTGLPNRARMNGHLADALERAEAAGTSVALVFMDLDDLKPINDSLGHRAGDEALRVVATRLMRCTSDEDLVARIGGDEFVAVLERPQAEADARAVADRFLVALSEPIRAGGRDVHVSASMGVSLYPADARSAEDLLRHADIAMHHAKQRGKSTYLAFTPEMDADARQRLLLEEGMRRALERDEFVLHYQPRVDAGTGRIACLEALVRWRHPERGLIPPGSFIPLAEATNLIHPLGRRVLELATRQTRAWRDEGFAEARVAVNVSARQLERPGFVEEVRAVLTESGLPAAALEIEVLESAAVKDVAGSAEKLAALKRLGVGVALDDFGMGYSNLAFLRRLPLDAIKVDRAFMEDLREAGGDRGAIVRAITALAKSLGLRVVAEGVEEVEQWRHLRVIGCDEAQGFLLARPVPAQEARALLERGFLSP